MAAKDPEQRKLAARVASLSRWSGLVGERELPRVPEDVRFFYFDLVDPEGVLPATERVRRAWRAYQRDLALAELRQLRNGDAPADGSGGTA